MRYLVQARLKPGQAGALYRAVEDGTLGQGSVAGDEYQRNLRAARVQADGTATWVEVCFCDPPLAEERPYWEEFFDLLAVQDAHARRRCRHENGTAPWACLACHCTRRLEARLERTGRPFLPSLKPKN